VRSTARPAQNSNQHNAFDVVTVDSESSADEFEDATDFNNAEYIFTDSPPAQPLNRHLSKEHLYIFILQYLIVNLLLIQYQTIRTMRPVAPRSL